LQSLDFKRLWRTTFLGLEADWSEKGFDHDSEADTGVYVCLGERWDWV